MTKVSTPSRLVIFGASNIVSDLFDCALANGLVPAKVVLHLPESAGERDIPLAVRIANLTGFCDAPQVETLEDFQPGTDEVYLLGPTTPTRANRAAEIWADCPGSAAASPSPSGPRCWSGC